jgi:hypothetical protein
MELMTNGDLKTYLRMRRPDNEVLFPFVFVVKFWRGRKGGLVFCKASNFIIFLRKQLRRGCYS